MLLPEPSIDVHANGRVDVEIPELVLSHDQNERSQWKKAHCNVAKRIDDPKHRGVACIPLNAITMNHILDDLHFDAPTILNKDRGAFYHQPKCHYSEMKLACHLIADEGFLPSELLYENWRLSSRAKAFGSRSVMQRTGAQRVQDCLGTAFLQAMSALIERNKSKPIDSFFPYQRIASIARGPNHDDHVDIFAYSAGLVRCAILEVKRDSERFSGHQAILLAYAGYLMNAHRAELGLALNLRVDIGFVRFSSSKRQQRSCRVSFNTA
jgi:hypothetical protein